MGLHLLVRVSIILLAAVLAHTAAAAPVVDRVIDVAPVWAGYPVAFNLITRAPRQYVGFYSAGRDLTIGVRELNSEEWDFVTLPTAVGWDSHNSIAMAFDDAGHLHIAANMHGVPLVYFRTALPGDIHSIEKVDAMTGEREARCTYPNFFRGPAGEFIFTYRDGGSGNGDQIYNIYDAVSRSWRRLLDRPLTDGEGLMNAYFRGPSRGPDGWFHLVWVWRDNPGCETNHDLSYARSRDLVHWEKSDGTPYDLPITLAECEIVDPVPIHGGMINGNTKLGFDSMKRPVIGYHKFDAGGNTQLFNARLEDGKWVHYPSTDWDYRWWFEGFGSMRFEIGLEPVVPAGPGKLRQDWTHIQYGAHRSILDEATLRPIEIVDVPAKYPKELTSITLGHDDAQVNWAGDGGRSDIPGARYALRWETMKSNRDKPRPEGDFVGTSTLRLYRFTEQ